MTRCRKCRRVLTNPEYIKLGYGKVCYEKSFGLMPRIAPSKMPGIKCRNHKSDGIQLLLDDDYFTDGGGGSESIPDKP